MERAPMKRHTLDGSMQGTIDHSEDDVNVRAHRGVAEKTHTRLKRLI